MLFQNSNGLVPLSILMFIIHNQLVVVIIVMFRHNTITILYDASIHVVCGDGYWACHTATTFVSSCLQHRHHHSHCKIAHHHPNDKLHEIYTNLTHNLCECLLTRTINTKHKTTFIVFVKKIIFLKSCLIILLLV